MDSVSGVKQKPLSMGVAQVESCLQLLEQPARSQNATLFVALRQFVSGALRHVPPPVYTVHGPPQTPPTGVLQ